MKKSIIIGVVAFLIGVGVGAGDTGEPVSEPETETVTKTVEVAPQVCADALTAARNGFELASKFIRVSSKTHAASAAMVSAVQQQNLSEMARITTLVQGYNRKAQAITGQMNFSTFQADAAECEEAVG